MDYTALTLGSLMSYKDQNIRRQAIAIFKLLPKATEEIGKAYVKDAMTRANDIDRDLCRYCGYHLTRCRCIPS
jgi:hypothetical protein